MKSATHYTDRADGREAELPAARPAGARGAHQRRQPDHHRRARPLPLRVPRLSRRSRCARRCSTPSATSTSASPARCWSSSTRASLKSQPRRPGRRHHAAEHPSPPAAGAEPAAGAGPGPAAPGQPQQPRRRPHVRGHADRGQGAAATSSTRTAPCASSSSGRKPRSRSATSSPTKARPAACSTSTTCSSCATCSATPKSTPPPPPSCASGATPRCATSSTKWCRLTATSNAAAAGAAPGGA